MSSVEIQPQLRVPGQLREIKIATALTLLLAIVYGLTGDLMITLALGAAPLGLVLCIRYPLQICTLFVAFSFFRLHDAYPMLAPFKIPLALGLLMSACLILHLFVLQTVEPFLNTELKRLGWLCALVVIGVVFAQDRIVAWNYFSGVYSKILLMTVAIAWMARTDKDFRFIARTLVVGGSLIAAVAIYNKLNGIGLVEGTRVTIGAVTNVPWGQLDSATVATLSSLADPNDLSLVLLFPLAFALSLVVYRSSRIDTLLGLFSAAAITLAIVYTQSRGGLIGVVAVVAVIGARVIKSRSILITLGLVTALGLGAAMGLKGRVSGGEAELEKNGIDDSAMGRIYAWETAINMAIRRPLTGVGINNFASSYYLYTNHWQKQNKAVHSTWFQVLGEMGLPGLIVFLLLVAATARSALRTLRQLITAGSPPMLTATALSLVSGLAGFCAAGTFLTQAFTWQLYVLIGLTAGLGRAAEHWVAKANPAKVQAQVPVQISSRPQIRGLYAR